MNSGEVQNSDVITNVYYISFRLENPLNLFHL